MGDEPCPHGARAHRVVSRVREQILGRAEVVQEQGGHALEEQRHRAPEARRAQLVGGELRVRRHLLDSVVAEQGPRHSRPRAGEALRSGIGPSWAECSSA